MNPKPRIVTANEYLDMRNAIPYEEKIAWLDDEIVGRVRFNPQMRYIALAHDAVAIERMP